MSKLRHSVLGPMICYYSITRTNVSSPNYASTSIYINSIMAPELPGN